MAELFNLNVMKTSQEERIIKGHNGEPDSKYYVVCLSNGQKTFEVTCGEKNPLVSIDVFSRCKVSFDIVDKKIKPIDALPLAPSMAGKGGAK